MDVAETTNNSHDALRDIRLQLLVVEKQCETTKSLLVALRERLEDYGQAALEQAITEEPTIQEAARAIRTKTLDALHQEFPGLVVEAPEAVPGEEMVDRLDDTASRLTNHHDRLMEAVNRLAELQDSEPFSHTEVYEVIDEAVTRTNEIKSAVKRIQRLIEEMAPSLAEETDSEYVVTGMVTHGGEPLSNVLVRVFDRDLRGVEKLGETTTDGQGRYEISYEKADFERAEHGSADVLVAVYDESGRRVGRSEVVHNAGVSSTIDVQLDAEKRVVPVEYTRLRHELKPVLDNNVINQLSDEDIAFLRSELQFASRDIYPAGSETLDLLVDASNLADETAFDERLAYALARQGYELSTDALISVDRATLTSALRTALEEQIIDGDFDELEDRLTEALDELERNRARENWSLQATTIRVKSPGDGPRAGLSVTLVDPETGDRIATGTTADDGTVSITYEGPSSAEGKQERTVDVTLTTQFGEQLFSGPVDVTPEGTTELSVEDEATTDEIGPVIGFPDLAEQLAASGYGSPAAVADSSPAELRRQLGEGVSRAKIERVHFTATAQTFLLDSEFVDRRTRVTNGIATPDWKIDGSDGENGGGDDE